MFTVSIFRICKKLNCFSWFLWIRLWLLRKNCVCFSKNCNINFSYWKNSKLEKLKILLCCKSEKLLSFLIAKNLFSALHFYISKIKENTVKEKIERWDWWHVMLELIDVRDHNSWIPDDGHECPLSDVPPPP